MSGIKRIEYSGSFPKGFFTIPKKIYKDLDFLPEESEKYVKELFDLKMEDHKIIIYTDHENIRLTGIFPKAEDHCYFGYWESINDLELNKELFEMLHKDAILLAREKIIGPMHFNTFHRYRLRLRDVPSWGMFDREPVNPTYYPELLEKLGFNTGLTYESRYIPASEIEKIYRDKEKFVSTVEEIPYEIIPLNSENWITYEDDIFKLVENIFAENPGYNPINFSEFLLLYNQDFADKLCPNTACLFRDKETGKLVSLSFCLPNYKDLEIENPRFEPDFFKLKNPTLLAKTLGVHPRYRNMNLMNYSGAYGMLSFREVYEDIIFCLMKTDNHSLHFTEGIPCEKAFYALYEKQLGQ
jgi:hypothetical protein